MVEVPAISFDHVNVTFKQNDGQVTAVDDVSLQIKRGEIFGIIGYSGAGKSTLVRLINYLQKPTSGSVTVGEQNLANLSETELRQKRRQIGMIFQHFNLMKSRSVINNVEFPLLDSKISKEERRQKALQLLKTVDLAEYADAFPDQLSGGQKQRVAIARALASDPKILISDESTSALDPKTTKSILALLKKLNQQLNLTIVLITHEMQVVEQICDHVAVMRKGQLIEEGTVEQIFTAPKQALTKEFIDTATNVKDAIARVKADTTVSAEKNELLLLKFVGHTTNQAVISEISRRFQVDANILFADVNQINSTTIGNLIIELLGKQEAREAAIQYLGGQGIRINRLTIGGAEE